MKTKSTIKKVFIITLFFASVVCVFYYSWLPDPSLKTEGYLPKWILNWSNQYFNLRTAVPFVFIGFLIEFWISSFSSSQKKQVPFRLEILGFAACIVCIAEGGQFFIEDRHPDFMDIVFGIAGGSVGIVLCRLIRVLIRLLAQEKNSV